MLAVTLVRHGVSEGNLRDEYCGWSDVPLAPKGEQALREYRAAGVYPEADLHYSSPLTRCRQTFDLAFGPSVRPDALLDGFKEAYFAEMEGTRTTPEGHSAFCARWLAGEPIDEAPHMESCAHLRSRAFGALADVVRRMGDAGARTAAVVTHSFFIRGLITRLMGWEPARWYDFEVPNGLGYTLELEVPHGDPTDLRLLRAVPLCLPDAPREVLVPR